MQFGLVVMNNESRELRKLDSGLRTSVNGHLGQKSFYLLETKLQNSVGLLGMFRSLLIKYVILYS
jgi:hypothetical protein